MERDVDKAVAGRGVAEHGAAEETELRQGDDDPARPDLVLDERLTSAAAPFLSMLSAVLIAAVGYFVYLFLRA